MGTWSAKITQQKTEVRSRRSGSLFWVLIGTVYTLSGGRAIDTCKSQALGIWNLCLYFHSPGIYSVSLCARPPSRPQACTGERDWQIHALGSLHSGGGRQMTHKRWRNYLTGNVIFVLYIELKLVDVKDWILGEGPLEEVMFASYQSRSALGRAGEWTYRVGTAISRLWGGGGLVPL